MSGLFIPLLMLGGAAVVAAAARKPSGAPPARGLAGTHVLDASLSPDDRNYLLGVLADPYADPAALEQFGRDLQRGNFPMSAAAVQMRAAEIRAQWPTSTAPGSFPSPSSPLSSGASAPPPSGVPVSLPLDPTHFMGMPASPSMMPAELQSEVATALTFERDPAKLQQFASYLKGRYPTVAQLLLDRADELQRGTGAPVAPPSSWSPTSLAGWSTAASSNVPPPAGPKSVPSAPPAPVASSAERNAKRPTGYPFIVLRGEATYPAKIAQQATGAEGNYPEMTKLNPQFAPDGVHWVDIRFGDELNIPWSWAPKLNQLYDIQVDHGVVPPPEVISAASATVPSEGPAPIASAVPTSVTTAPTSATTAPSGVLTSAMPPASSPPPVATTGVLVSATTPPVRPTYKVLKGDFPIKIAQKLVGDGNRWHELVAANPQKKTQADGNFASLQPNETLFLPDSWAPASIASTGGSHAANA